MIVELIRNEYQNRRRVNPKYSLRAFAQSIGVPAGRLSEYLSGKRKVTDEAAEKIAIRLGKNTMLFRSRLSSEMNFVEDEIFTVIADWQHFAILSLMDIKSFKSDPSWIAERLGLSEFDIKESLRRLQRVGLLKVEGKQFVKTHKNIFTGSDRESSALKLSHTQSLQQAVTKLHEVPVEIRDITSITMAIDLKRISLAKKMIAEFRRKLCGFLEEGSATEVYNLNIQLVPVTKLSEGVKK